MIARIKSNWCMYKFNCFDGSAAYINCYPQQKWEVVLSDKNGMVLLDRKGISIEIPKAEFEKNWRIVGE